jgi:hypothetical protein
VRVIRLHTTLLAGCLAILASASVGAQTAEPVAATARLHIGPLALDPAIAVRNLGIDTNALNASDDPDGDFTATITPELREWLRLGRLALSGTSSVDWNYFQKLTSQRSFNGGQEGRADLALGYVGPYALGAVARTRQRPNLEIDARVERTMTAVGGGLVVHAGTNLSVDISQEHRTIDFGRTEFGDVTLAESLNRSERETRLAARYALTPLTTLLVSAAHRRDRFVHAIVRDTDTVVGMAGLEFKPLALLAGRASVGWRRFTPKGPALPAFRGVVSDVEVTYQIRDVTRLSVAIARDVEYSFELLEPYYVSTNTRVTVVQALGAAWDLVGRAGHTLLDYRQVLEVTGLAPGSRVDEILVVGGGFGRRLASDVRIGIDLDHAARRSSAGGRDYDGMRVGGSVTYGF